MKIGDPMDPETELGPLVSFAHREKVVFMISPRARHFHNGEAASVRAGVQCLSQRRARFARAFAISHRLPWFELRQKYHGDQNEDRRFIDPSIEFISVAVHIPCESLQDGSEVDVKSN